MNELDDIADDAFDNINTPGVERSRRPVLTHDEEANSDGLRNPDELLLIWLYKGVSSSA